MCQCENKRIHSKSTKCYRVYKMSGGSYYNDCQRPPIGVPTKASTIESFYAFRTKKDVQKWLDDGDVVPYHIGCLPRKYFDVFECILEDGLESGVWGDDYRVHICTGNTLTVVRHVGEHHPTTPSIINWYKL